MRSSYPSLSLMLTLLAVSTVVIKIAPVQSQDKAPKLSAPAPVAPPAEIKQPVSKPVLPALAPIAPTVVPPEFKIPEFKVPDVKPSKAAPPQPVIYQPVYTPSAYKLLSAEERQRHKKWKQTCSRTQTDYQSLVTTGLAAFVAGDWNTSIAQLTLAIEVTPPAFAAPVETPFFFELCWLNPPQPSMAQALREALLKQANQLRQQENLKAAIQSYQQALRQFPEDVLIRQELKTTLLQWANQLEQQGLFAAAIAHYQQAFLLDLPPTKEALRQGQQLPEQPLQAIAYLRIVLEQGVESLTPAEKLAVYLDLGAAYARINDNPAALESYQLVAAQAEKLGDRMAVITALIGQAKAYTLLGQTEAAVALYQQAYRQTQIVGLQQVNDQIHSFRFDILLGLGDGFYVQGDLEQAQEYYNQALTSAQAGVNNDQQLTTALNALRMAQGQGYGTLVKIAATNQKTQQLEEQLRSARNQGDLDSEITILLQLGDAYLTLQRPKDTYKVYMQALEQQIKNNDLEGAQNTHKKIRDLLQASPQLVGELRKIVSPEYLREFIRGLLELGEPCPALIMTDVLKVVEAENYLASQTLGRTRPHLVSGKLDTAIESLQRTALQQIQELEDLQQIPEANRTSQQRQQLEQLKLATVTLFELFAEFLNSSPVTTRLTEVRRNSQGEGILFSQACAALETVTRQQRRRVALFYPLLLPDNHLALMLYISGVGPFYKIAPISRAALTQEVKAFQTAILAKEGDFQQPYSQMRQSAQRLYQRLLEPFELDLQTAEVQTIIYASDDILRYIPLSALHTGDRWLIKAYEIQYIIASSITDFNTPPHPDRRVLAGAFASGQVTVPIGMQPITYGGLPSAKSEIDNLKAHIPNTTQLVDRNFSVRTVLRKKGGHTMIHFATHAFFGSTPDDSYILFGDGYSTLRSMADWNLQNIDLLTLGACATAFGGQLGDGREILGFGYQAHRAGAKATLASLWSVQDDSTQVFMDRFYAALTQNQPKVAASRRAQLDLLSGRAFSNRQPVTLAAVLKPQAEPTDSQIFSHPYYWAPFILIGNGL